MLEIDWIWFKHFHVEAKLMMTSSNGNIFRVTGPLCGEFTGPGEFPTQRPVTRSFDVFFDLRLNKRLSKQPRGWWFETPSWSLWRHCNVLRKRSISWSQALLLKWINLIPSMENLLHPVKCVGGNYLSIRKRQRWNRWKLGMNIK